MPDRKFVECCYLVMREILECSSLLTIDQFFKAEKFIALKVQLVSELAKAVYDLDEARQRKGVRKEKEKEKEREPQRRLIQKY